MARLRRERRLGSAVLPNEIETGPALTLRRLEEPRTQVLCHLERRGAVRGHHQNETGQPHCQVGLGCYLGAIDPLQTVRLLADR